MVSSRRGTYRADIVRLIHGDPNPTGPGLREEVFESSVNGEYAGREQVITKGSYVVVPDNPLIRNPKSVCIQAWIWPTTPDKGIAGHRDQVVGGRVTGVRALHRRGRVFKFQARGWRGLDCRGELRSSPSSLGMVFRGGQLSTPTPRRWSYRRNRSLPGPTKACITSPVG